MATSVATIPAQGAGDPGVVPPSAKHSKDGGTDRVTVNSDAPPGNQGEAPKKDDRPAWLPEKFKTPEDLAKSYKELEAKLGGKPAETPLPPPAIKQDSAVAEKAVEKSGLDMSEFTSEFASKGKLSDDSYKKLADKGITKETADSYIEGQKARAVQYAGQLAESVGGKEQMDALYKWAGQTLSAEELGPINKAIESMNVGLAKTVLAGLKARFTAENGSEPQLIDGGEPVATAGVKAFESSTELINAMRSKEYKTDPAFRKKVEQRLARTNLPVRYG